MSTPIELFNYNLPEELIAYEPISKRDECRLLTLNRSSGEIIDYIFKDIVDLIDDKYFLVVNNTKVMNARLKAKKLTGGESELFVTKVINKNEGIGLVKGRFKEGQTFLVEGVEGTLLRCLGDGLWHVKLDSDIEKLMNSVGHIPLPPYINRADNDNDKYNYQTIFSKHIGSVAAPTAGLHFTNELINKLKVKGIKVLEITLDVGIGTFRPVKTPTLEEHNMHFERYEINDDVAEEINYLKLKGKKLIAVGSTVVRALESATDNKRRIHSGVSETDLLILPSYEFKIVDEVITNFHLPKSTLLAMVSAFAGIDLINKSYKYAIENRYRFFSYGDAMYIY